MKKLTKIASLLFAVVMLVALGVTAVADSGSITITNASVGETYSIYKLLDLTYNVGGTSYAYTIDPTSAWYDFFVNDEGKNYVSVDVTTYQVTWTDGNTGTDSQAKAFAKAALAYAETNIVSATASDTATDTTLTFSNLEYGYYLIDSSLGSVLTLDSTAPSVNVEDKNETPTVEKTVMEDSSGTYGESNTADVGEIVYFRIEITDGYASSNLVLHDALPDGLTLNANSFVVAVGSSQASAEPTVDSQYYTITTPGQESGCSFEIAFKDDFTSSVLTSSQIIIVTYTATVNADAVIYGTGNSNVTYVSYGNASKSTSDSTTTFVYELYVYKYTTETGTSTEVALSGAKFILYREVNGTNYYAVLDSDGIVSSWTTTQADATELTTDSTGLVYFGGLDAGTYYLVETEAPSGYNPLAAATTVVIAQDGIITGAGTVTDPNNNTATIDAIKIYNGSSEEMPSTGGIGTTIFYVVGGILVVGAVVLLITRRRMKNSK